MKRMFMLLTMLSLCGLTTGKTETRSGQANDSGESAKTATRTEKVTVTGQTMSREGTLTRCSGGCRIVTDKVILKADELNYSSDTRTADAHGNVTMKLIDSAAN